MTTDQAHVLYRMYSADNRLLYVGITNNPTTRFASHQQDKWWWDTVELIRLENFGSRAELRQAERDAIKAELPLHNVTHNPNRPPVPTRRRIAVRCASTSLPDRPLSSFRTYSLPEVAAKLNLHASMVQPERWLTRQIAIGRFIARRVGRHWRMTQSDIDFASSIMRNRAYPAVAK